jgi:phosphatidylinositol-3-phosphatase
VRRGLAALACLAALVAGAALAPGSPAAPAPRIKPAKPPHVKHVFIIVLENEDATATFGPGSKAPYLAKRLTAKGELLPNYYGIGHNSNDNYLAMVSGQAPNLQTQLDCQFFSDFTPGTPAPSGQYVGQGCVYPPPAETIANQLEDSGYAWRGYMQDVNKGAPPGTETPCRHPAIGARDPNQHAVRGDQYATRHNPFVYFHSIINFPTCKRNDVDLTHLNHDLKRERRTPNYSFIVPNLCNDGHDSPCVNGQPGGLVSANRFLRRRVPKILHSPAYRDRGLLIVTFDEAEAVGATADSSACCNERPGPNVIPPNTPGFIHPGPGGGRVGAVLLSPCLKPGTVARTPYNHYSLLRSIEDNFGLPHLGYAGQPGLAPFGRNVLNRPRCR